MKIAIQANPTRGKEIISLLESLGGSNSTLGDNGEVYTYYIDKNNIIRYDNAPKDYKVYTLEEFEKEFPFKVGDEVLHKKHKAIVEMFVPREKCYYIRYSNPPIDGIYYTKWTTATELKMKEERNITLTLDKAKEWYNKGGELKEIALQAFTEQELNPLPRSWEEYSIRYESWCFSTRYTNIPLKYSALLKLEQLRDCWRQGWEPTKANTGYSIIKYPTDYLIMSFNFISFLSFPTKKMAKEFLECFRDLIEQAGDLI